MMSMGLFMPTSRSMSGSGMVNLHEVHETLKFHGMDHTTLTKVEDAYKEHGTFGVEKVMDHLRKQPDEHRIADHHLDAIENAFRKHTS